MAMSEMEPFDGRFEDFRWIAAQTLPAKEFAAHRLLTGKGFAALVPKVERNVRYSRHSKATKPVHFALMPGYVIVGLPCGRNWMEVYRAGLVRGVVGRMMDGLWSPFPILVKPLRALVERHGDGSDAQVMGPAREPGELFSVTAADIGGTVELVAGPMAGHKVELHEIDGDVARILLPLFGGAVVTTPIDNIARRSQS